MTGPFVVLLWLHQGARAERSLTAWCPKTMRYKPPQGLFSQAPSHNGSLGSSQHTNIFSSLPFGPRGNLHPLSSSSAVQPGGVRL